MITPIKNLEHLYQKHDFEGVVDEGLHSPSDIDGVIDWNGKAFIYFEGKYNRSEMPSGQKKGLEFLVDANKYPCMAIVYNHISEGETVIVKSAEVIKYYINNDWHYTALNVKQLVKAFKDKFV